MRLHVCATTLTSLRRCRILLESGVAMAMGIGMVACGSTLRSADTPMPATTGRAESSSLTLTGASTVSGIGEGTKSSCLIAAAGNNTRFLFATSTPDRDGGHYRVAVLLEPFHGSGDYTNITQDQDAPSASTVTVDYIGSASEPRIGVAASGTISVTQLSSGFTGSIEAMVVSPGATRSSMRLHGHWYCPAVETANGSSGGPPVIPVPRPS